MTNDHTEPMKVGEECREDFEQWMRDWHPFSFDPSTGDDGNYLHDRTQDRFDGWKGAWSRRTEPSPAEVRSEGLPDLGERIKHVGGRINDAGYVEFGSVMAIDALIAGVLRDAGGNCG